MRKNISKAERKKSAIETKLDKLERVWEKNHKKPNLGQILFCKV
jgi:hypothetical protein